MTSAYILIAAMLVLGGLIASLGDRLGTKVGKARLRLFNLRPKQTAALVTVVTGTVISASTLLLLFGLSESLREGVFELDDILKKRRALKRELAEVVDQKNEVEEKLLDTQQQQNQAQQRLNQIEDKFEQAQSQLKRASGQVDILRQDIKSLLGEREKLVQRRNQLDQEIEQLREQLVLQDQEIATQTNEIREQEQKIQTQQKLLSQQEDNVEQLKEQQKTLKAEISSRDEALQRKESNLSNLEQQLALRQQQFEALERGYEELRRKDIAIARNQVLHYAVVRIIDPNSVQAAVDEILRNTNRKVNQLTNEKPSDRDQQIVKITRNQVLNLISNIRDGREYVVRIFSGGNYVQGETEIRVFADVTVNRRVFSPGETIASIGVDKSNMSLEQIQTQVDWLIAASEFRARRAGIIGKLQVEDGHPTKLISFIEQLQEYDQPIEEIKAVTPEWINTSGPMRIRLVAIQDGEVLFST